MSIKSLGLSSLMEATKLSKKSEDSSEALVETFEEAIDEDIVGCLTGDDSPDVVGDDSVESDIAGNGINDDEMEKLLDKIPPSDDGIEDQIEQLTESCLPVI